MPGKTGTQAICRQYAIFSGTKFPQQAWKLISFLGGKDEAGKYTVAKRWWVEQGLNFGYKSMAEDPEIKKFVEAWGNLEAYNKVLLAALARAGGQGALVGPLADGVHQGGDGGHGGEADLQGRRGAGRAAVEHHAPGLRAH